MRCDRVFKKLFYISVSKCEVMSEPINRKLYEMVKREASKKFSSKSGVYRSSWIVREYKKRGGKFRGSKPKMSGLKRWYKERWVDLNRPKRGKVRGYSACGRRSSKMKSGEKYPLCRPSKRVNSRTPKTYKELSSEKIRKAKRDKSRVKGKSNIRFGGGRNEWNPEYKNTEKLSMSKDDFIRYVSNRSDEKYDSERDVSYWNVGVGCKMHIVYEWNGDLYFDWKIVRCL